MSNSSTSGEAKSGTVPSVGGPHVCSFDEREGGCPVCLDIELSSANASYAANSSAPEATHGA